jgi:hypothetical protein
LINSLQQLTKEAPQQYNSGDPLRDVFNIRKSLNRIRDEASFWRKYKNDGYVVLPLNLQGEFLRLTDICSKYGIFIVPYGELESWLKPYGLDNHGKKSNWIVSALTKIPEIPVDEAKPLWKFILQIHKYLLNQ